MTPETMSFDWTALLKSPLFLVAPLAVGVALFDWLVTEAASFFVPSKYRPVVAIGLGPFLGWATQATELLDFGGGPSSWARALLFGLLGGALAVLGHDQIKGRWPFSLLSTRTPSATPAPPAGGTN